MAKGEPNDGLPDVDIEVLMDQADSAADKMAAALGALQKTTSRVKAIRGGKTSADAVDADEDSPAPSGDNIPDEEKLEGGLLVNGGSLEQTELAVEMVDELMDEVVRQVEPADSKTESSSQSEEALDPSPPQTEAAALSAEESPESAASEAAKQGAANQNDVGGPPADSESKAIAQDENSAEEPKESESTSTEPTPDRASNMSETPGEDSVADSATDPIGNEESVTDVAEAALAATESLIHDIESKEDPAAPADSTTADSNQNDTEEEHSPDASAEKETDSGDAMDAMEALVAETEEESKQNGSDESDVDDGSSDEKDPIDEVLSSMEDLIENLDQGPAPEQAPEQADEEAPAESDQKEATFEEFDRDDPSAAASGGETVSGDTVLKASSVPNETSSVASEEPSSDQEIDADSVLADMEALIAEATSDSAPSAPTQEQKDDTTADSSEPEPKSESEETPSDGGDQPAQQDGASDGDAISIGSVAEAEETGSGKSDEDGPTPESVEKKQAPHSADSTEGSETGDEKVAPDGDADETVAAPSEPKVPLVQRVPQFCLRIVRRAFKTLDIPFSGIHGRWKTLAGYLALGTLFMALTTWVVSSFGNLQ